MAINLLRLARFVDGERPSAEKFNKLFSYIENKLSILNSTIGDSVNNGVTSIVDINSQTTFDIKINNIWGISKFLAENVINGRTRHSDIMSVVKSIGSMSNLNPLTLGGVSSIKETIPPSVNEYVFNYPVKIKDPIQNSLEFLDTPNWLNQQDGFVAENEQLLEFGQWKFSKTFEIDDENSNIIKYAKSIVWYTTSTTSVDIKYDTNSENWGGGANYQGSSFNVIPDFNTPKNSLNTENAEGFFYNLKFTNNGGSDTTVELPYVLYQQTAHSRNELATALLNEGDINFKKRLKLPKYLKDYQLTLNPTTTEFPLPKGFLTLVDFSESSFTILDGLTYTYVDEHTFKVTGLSTSILNCVTADPNSDSYTQLFLLVNGTDITRSINDLQIKQSKHSHDGTFGEPLIHIKDITGIFEKTDRNLFFPSEVNGHFATQYFHRDGYIYNNDPQNYDNAIMGDLLISGNKSNSNKRSYKIYFKDYNSTISGLDSSPGYFSLPGLNSNNWSWIGLSSIPDVSSTNTLNIQGSEDGNLSILSNNDLNILSKTKFVSILKEINTADSSKDVIESVYEWPNIKNEASAQIQTESLNANINQTQISLVNDNNQIDLYNLSNTPPTISILSENKTITYSEFLDQTGKTVGLNSIQLISEFDETDNEIRTFTQGTNTSLFQRKEEYLSDKRESASKDFFKKEIPSYIKEYKETSSQFFTEGQDGALENTNVFETNNATQKKEGCFVYVIQHLVDDRNDPNFKNWFASILRTTDYDYYPELSSMIDKKHIFNTTYDLVRQQKIINKQSIYQTFTSKTPAISYFSAQPNFNSLSGDLMYVDSDTGVLRWRLKDDTTLENFYDLLPLEISNQLGGGNHYNSTPEIFDGENSTIYLRRWYKHNPFPSSKEYINQHFYIYGFRTGGRNRLYRITREFFNSVNTNPPTIESEFNYIHTFAKTRVLTKMIWKKFWLKENVNQNNFDFEELLLHGEERYNNDKYILVNQGYLIDCAKPIYQDDSNYSIETFNWILNDESEINVAKANNYYRFCEFYEVDKESNFYELYPNWIAGQSFEPSVFFDSSIESNLQAINASITGGLPFTRHGNLQNAEDYTNFFNYFKKHEFEDDNVILYFGKGFVTFNEKITTYNPSNIDLVAHYDIVLDNHWGENKQQLERTLNIKLKDSSLAERNYKSKENIKIIFSDFQGENLTLINQLLPEDEKLHPSIVNSYSSVTDYLYNIFAQTNSNATILLNIFNSGSDFKIYNRFVWQRKVLGDYLNLKETFQNSDFINNKKWREFFSSGIIDSSIFNVLFTPTFNVIASPPRTFFTFINIDFERDVKTNYFSRKLSNQINLKTNESSDHFVNGSNLLLKLKASFDWVWEAFDDSFVQSRNEDSFFNIGPIQGFYDIKIDKFINNEQSWWSIADQMILKEKFGCSIYNIEVNTDLNYCFIV